MNARAARFPEPPCETADAPGAGLPAIGRWTARQAPASRWVSMAPPATPSLRGSDMAIDVGTAAVRVAAGAQLIRERRAASDGRGALAGGVIVDENAAVEVLRPILRHARRGMGFSRIRALACAPSDATADEKAALTGAIARAGAAAVFISPEPLAAAIGSGIDVASPYAKLIIDIGEGVTDCAVIRSAQIVMSHAVRKGCAGLRERIAEHALQRHGLVISEAEADRVLREVGVGGDAAGELTSAGLRGGVPCALPLRIGELHAELAPAQEAILGCVETLLRALPPPLSVEVIEDGLFLTGGGALLKGMREQIAHVAQLDTHMVADPLRAVVWGARAMLPTAATLQLWRG